jgi:hypothetical protein
MIRLGLSTSYFSVPDSNDKLMNVTRWNLGSSPLRASYYFSAFANLTYPLITDRTQKNFARNKFQLKNIHSYRASSDNRKRWRYLCACHFARLCPTLPTHEVEELSL